MRPAGVVAGLCLLVSAPAVRAVPLDAVPVGREWHVASLEIEGTDTVSGSRLRDAMLTKERAWYRFWEIWRPRPPFDPITFRADIDRLRQVYRNEGFYEAHVSADVDVPEEGDAVGVVVHVDEGPPVHVGTVRVVMHGADLGARARKVLLGSVPVTPGDRFTQADYARVATLLRTYYREHGFARADVERHATVDLRDHRVAVEYRVASGPPSVFGKVTVAGTESVDPAVVRRELAFRPGQPFRQSLVDRTRENLVALRLFKSVRVTEEGGADDPTVGVGVRVAEGPSHEVRLGIGYDTDEQIRGIASWRDYDFFGGARQLGFTARASFVRRTITADFLQPHFPGPKDRVQVFLSESQEDEDAYTNDRSRFMPRLEWAALPQVTPYAFYRIEYDSLSGVNAAIRRAIPDIAPANGFLSGLGFGVDVTTADDLLDPSRGWVANASVEPVGGFLGGSFSFLRVVAEGRRYQPLPARFLAAFRLRAGAADPIAGGDEIPLFERFYAGGLNSVRGYDRRRVGPKIDDEPIGGRSLAEVSAELRHPITEKFGAAVFLDGGQVSVRSWHPPFDDLQWGTGFGVRYTSPVGPIRVDLGFPLERPPGDPAWQVHVSIGQTF
jgi:outer membrane protein insertion porin family